MVLIIQLRSERRRVVNEKYTDSDLCKVSLQMTELTNSSRGAVEAGKGGRGPCLLEIHLRFIRLNPQVARVGWALTGSERSEWSLTPVSAPEITAAEGGNLRPELGPGTRGVGTSRKTTV